MSIGFRQGFATVTAAIRDATVLATALLNGTLRKEDFAKLAGVVDGNRLVQTFMSAEIDFASAASSVLVIPAQAGFGLNAFNTRIILTAAAGVLATPVTVKAGNNGTFDNVIAAGTNGIPTAASHAAAVSLGVPLFATSYVAQAPSLPLVNLGTAVTFKVTTAATGTGGFVMKGKLIYVYMAQPLASI